MKKLFLLLICVSLISCEKIATIPESKELVNRCMDCTTIVTYEDGTKESYLVFACTKEEIQKRLDLNKVGYECGKVVKYETTCVFPNTKCK